MNYPLLDILNCNYYPFEGSSFLKFNKFSFDFVAELVCVLQDPYCFNGGTCSETSGDIAMCECITGFVGERCETGN